MPVNEQPTTLREHYLFKYLTPQENDRLMRISARRTLPEDHIIWNRGDEIDYIVVLLKGKLKITLLDRTGNEFAIRHIFPVDSLGDATIIHRQGQMADVSVVEKSEVLFVPKNDIVALLKNNCAASFALSTELSRRINNLTRELELQVFSRSKLKIMYKLLQLKPANSNEVRITHQQLAELVGMTREKLTIGLEELQNQGYVKKARGKIIIRDEASLAEEVDSF